MIDYVFRNRGVDKKVVVKFLEMEQNTTTFEKSRFVMSYIEQSNDEHKRYIDACQARTAYLAYQKRKQVYRGSMYWNESKGKEYLVLLKDGKTQTIGSRSPATEDTLQAFSRGKKESRENFAQAKLNYENMIKINKALRIGRAPDVMVELIDQLDQSGLSSNFFVIGTNALYAYETHVGVRLHDDITATTDVDFLWDSRKKLTLTMNNEQSPTTLIGILQKVDPSFVLLDEGYRAINNVGYCVDIVKRRPASLFDDKEPGQPIRGVDDFWAAKIHHMDWLLSAPKFKQVIVSDRGRMAEMTTIDPRAFALFKLWMSAREDRDPIKKPRDIAQAKAVITLIQDKMPHLAFEDLHTFPEKLRQLVGQCAAPIAEGFSL